MVRSGWLGGEFGYSDEVVGDHPKGEGSVGTLEAPDLEFGDAADGFGPAERLFDPLSNPLADLVTGVAGGASIDGGLADLAMLGDSAVDCNAQASTSVPSTEK